MRLVGLVLAGILLGAAPAAAQYFIPRPPAPIGALPADDVADIVQAMGLDPVGPPMQSGPFYVQRAVDDYGRVLRVTVDARRSQVIAVEGGQRQHGYGYGRPHHHHPGYAALRPHDDLAPPGSVMAPQGARQVQPPRAAAPPATSASRPAVKSAAVPPQKTPVPRKRPASAPEQAAAGTVEPVAPPPPAPAPQPSAKPAEPASAVTPPVAPLE